MILCYFDESGDDGFPQYSSPLFVLTAIAIDVGTWHANYDKIYQHRVMLKRKYDLPIQQELHTKEFLQDKNPYHGKFTTFERKEIIFDFFKLIASLDIAIFNVVFDKENHKKLSQENNILEYTFSTILQNLNGIVTKKQTYFMVIVDEGRNPKMRVIGKKMQLKNFIEDTLAKDSKNSYFIQLADMIAYITTLYSLQNLMFDKKQWANRVRKVLFYGDERKLLDIIKEKLYKDKQSINKYGIVYYPIIHE